MPSLPRVPLAHELGQHYQPHHAASVSYAPPPFSYEFPRRASDAGPLRPVTSAYRAPAQPYSMPSRRSSIDDFYDDRDGDFSYDEYDSTGDRTMPLPAGGHQRIDDIKSLWDLHDSPDGPNGRPA